VGRKKLRILPSDDGIETRAERLLLTTSQHSFSKPHPGLGTEKVLGK